MKLINKLMSLVGYSIALFFVLGFANAASTAAFPKQMCGLFKEHQEWMGFDGCVDFSIFEDPFYKDWDMPEWVKPN